MEKSQVFMSGYFLTATFGWTWLEEYSLINANMLSISFVFCRSIVLHSLSTPPYVLLNIIYRSLCWVHANRTPDFACVVHWPSHVAIPRLCASSRAIFADGAARHTILMRVADFKCFLISHALINSHILRAALLLASNGAWTLLRSIRGIWSSPQTTYDIKHKQHNGIEIHFSAFSNRNVLITEILRATNPPGDFWL